MSETNHAYDIIPDTHGHHAKLARLLDTLGYRRHGDGRRHPHGRKALFLGDFLDRGPEVREVLHTVRGMVEAGDALAIIGNHEFNALGFHTPGPDGRPLRENSDKNVSNHAATLRAFAGHDAEWREWLAWLGGLPLCLDLGALRAVHACWSAPDIDVLRGARAGDPDFLRAAHRRGSREKRAVDHCLKGPEIDLPEGGTFRDKEGVERRKIRVRWWDLRPGLTLGEVCMPEPCACPEPLKPRHLARVPDYPADAPPVFFGHYWLPPAKSRAPLRPNLVCLDYSAGIGGPLVACRWNGPRPANWEFVETN
jgi:hypothetical protein